MAKPTDAKPKMMMTVEEALTVIAYNSAAMGETLLLIAKILDKISRDMPGKR